MITKNQTQWTEKQRKVRNQNRTETWWTCNHCGQSGCNETWVKNHSGNCDGDKTSWKRREREVAEIVKGRRWC